MSVTLKSFFHSIGAGLLVVAVGGWFGEASAQQIYWTNRFDGLIERADLIGRLPSADSLFFSRRLEKVCGKAFMLQQVFFDHHR